MADAGAAAEARLDERQQRMLELLRSGQARGAPDSMVTVTVSNEVPLTPDQARVWFFVRAFPSSAEYNQPVTLRYLTCPEPEALSRALAALVARHDALRLRFFERDGEPMQATQADTTVPVRWIDLAHVSPALASTQSTIIASAMLQQPFDPAEAPLVRALAIRLPSGRGLIALSIHHLIADGASIEILTGELIQLLREAELPPPPEVGFIDYAAWRQRRQAGPAHERARAYWRDRMSGDLPILDVPSDRPRPETPSRRGHTAPCRIAAATVARLREVADAAGATVFMALLAVYKTLLMRLSGQCDVIVGTPLLGRELPEIENTVGMFVNTVPLRTDLSGGIGFHQLLKRVRDTVLEAQDHRDIPFEQIVADSQVPRDIGCSPLFQTMFGFGGLPSSQGSDPEVNDVALDTGAAKWDLTLFLDEAGGAIGGHLEFAEDLFDEASAIRIVRMFEALCERLAANPNQPIARVALLSPAERRQILEDLNPYAEPIDRYRTMAQPFEAQVLRSPDGVAIESTDGRRISYAELNSAANRLAHWLAERGVGADSRVAICMERSPELIVAIYAVAKTGAAYVPIDPELPDERIAFMLGDIEPALTLVHAPTQARIVVGQVQPVDLDDANAPWTGYPMGNLPCTAPAHRPVHYLYTSGTTGRPKAVVYPVNGALAEISWLHAHYPSLGPGDTNIFLTSYGFDVSIWEIFWTLYFGARLVIPVDGDQRDPRRIAVLVKRYRATTLFLIPALLDAVLDEPDFAGLPDLRWVFSGGAPVSARLRDRFHARLRSTMLLNCYGPTEAGAVTDMALPRDPGNPIVPLGRPASNFRLYILDANLEPCPIGVPGEVYLGGRTGIAIGYHRRPSMTAERFIPDPFGEPGGRMYRTGDLCRYRADGVLEHLGRADRQLKVRGMRIEPAEIEAVLCEHPAVAQCHVLMLDEQGRAGQLPAFVALRPAASASVADLRRHALRLLPRHMVPTSILVLDQLPTNVNNKFDQTALRRLATGAPPEDNVAFAPAETAEQHALLDIFRDVVGYPEAGIDHNFFDIGGHSLLIFRLIARCESALGWRPAIADVFAAPTVRGLVEAMTSSRNSENRCLVPLAPSTGKPMIVLIHPAGGSVLPFVAIAQQLRDDFSVWGAQSPEQIDFPEWTIASLAALYAEALEPERGLSPVILAGWSMGGCIALEIARIWQAQGRAPAAILLLDTWVPPATQEERTRQRLSAALHALDVLSREGLASSDLDPGAAILDRLAATCRRNIEAFATYEPRPLDLPIDYLRAREIIAEANGDLSDALGSTADRGWGQFGRQVRVRDVDGDHFSMVGRANAASLAATLKAIIADRLDADEI